MTFQENLRRESANELLVANHIAAKVGGLIQAKKPGKDCEKDFVLLLPQPIEVKFDYKAAETGKMFFEVACSGKESGLKATTAAVWYHFVPPSTLFNYDPKIMLSHLRGMDKSSYAFVKDCGDGNASGVAVGVEYVRSLYFVESEEFCP